MNVELRSAKGKHSLAVARSPRRAAEADVINLPFFMERVLLI
jgi:hypothetical protein